jgi:hypothetical protein
VEEQHLCLLGPSGLCHLSPLQVQEPIGLNETEGEGQPFVFQGMGGTIVIAGELRGVEETGSRRGRGWGLHLT